MQTGEKVLLRRTTPFKRPKKNDCQIKIIRVDGTGSKEKKRNLS